MGSLAENAKSVLEPYVGAMVADTCVRATALSLGKTTDSLGIDDVDSIATSIRRLLAPIAPLATIDALILDLRKRAAA